MNVLVDQSRQEIAAVPLDDCVEIPAHSTAHVRDAIVLHYHVAGPRDRGAVAVDEVDVFDEQAIISSAMDWFLGRLSRSRESQQQSERGGRVA
jgi:hypothetical protein